MNIQELEGNWKVVKGYLKQRFSELTDEDLAYREGEFEEMIGKLQKKVGQKKEEFEKELKEITSKSK